MMSGRHHTRASTGRGFTMVSMLFILVALAALAAALASLSLRQHLGLASELAAAKAYQTALAGLEWGSHQLLRNPAPPAAAPACFGSSSFSPGGELADFTVTVTCVRTPPAGTVSDGATDLVFYELTATACNAPSSGACPASGSVDKTYVERQLGRSLMR